ncbi:related to sepB protein [Sporisorium reilianum f. sp. reilianum]|uniref:Related to sepB protein n=1 Tax=Sporisorium reilianum f. sp. reilianum TaxID=72559 RepID=A0A2N8UH55_9BASI|nr:related to sepB protein [Sporisorium reilianum f. sp. reilianum]
MQSTQSDDLHVQIVHTGPTKCIHAPKSAQVDRLFTGGDDYLVRILPTLPLPGVEPHLIEDATEPITSLDADSRFLVTASEDGSVRLYQHHPLDSAGNPTSPTLLQSLLRRESLPLRCVALERSVANGKAPRVAVCSDELIVKIIDVEDPRRIQLLDGHNRGLRSASWSPVAPLLVTCSTDGVARITDLSDVEPKFVKAIEGVLPSTRTEGDEAATACWHPSGTYFVMPSKAHELVIISAANDSSAWSRTGNFVASASGPVPVPSGSITALAFSPNGRYLASATTNGQVTVWDADSRQAIRHKRADALVNAISWHPSKDALAWTDNEGSLSRWSDVVGPTRPSAFEELTFDVSKAARGSRGRIDDIFAGTGLSDDEDDDALQRGHGGDADDLDDFVVDDETRSRRHAGADPYSRANARGGHAAPGRDAAMMVAATRAQPAFQSTATPMSGQRRFLAYNLLGCVVAVEQESHQTISFESFDTSARRNFRFSDMNAISMADLAKQGILFASKQTRDQPSSVFFKPFVAAGSNVASEWTFNLDHGEDVDAVALGGSALRTVSEDGWEDQDAARSSVGVAVVATSKGYLRFLSASGMQLYLWALGHPVVTLAVGARTALVIYRRSGVPAGGFQNLAYKVIDLSNYDVIQHDLLPLAQDAHVRWAGYNDQHQPAFYDSNGTLFILDRAHRARQGRWVPSLDTKRVRDLRGERFDSALPPSVAAAGAYSGSRSSTDVDVLDDDSMGKENIYRTSEKRKSPATDDDHPAPRTLIMPSKSAKLNPFARTSSNKDKQLHKSTSFFERIEPFEKEPLKSSSAAASAAASAKQSLLTGFAFRKDQPAAAAFGETQLDADDAERDESLQATLERAARKRGEPSPAHAVRGDALPDTMRDADESFDVSESGGSALHV